MCDATPVSWTPTLLADTGAHLRVDRLTAGYSTQPVVVDVSLEAARGEVVAVLGANGAGKSTLLRALVGELTVTSGDAYYDDRRITNLRCDRLVRLGVGYVPQLDPIFPTMSVAENLELGGYQLRRSVVARRLDEVMDILPGLRSLRKRTAGSLSGGEKRMVAIGRVLMAEPTLLLLDEPTANLSPRVAHVVLHEYVRVAADAGAAVVLVEQRVREALEIADRGYILVSGRNHLHASAAELRARDDIGSIFLGERTSASAS